MHILNRKNPYVNFSPLIFPKRYQGIFWEKVFLEVGIQMCISPERQPYQLFIAFFFHENIFFTSEVIALLVTAYIIHWKIFSHFFPPLT